jgi:hypothetical protein
MIDVPMNNLFDWDSSFEFDVALCSARRHREAGCGRILPHNDKKLLLLGFSCESCGEEWKARLSTVKARQFYEPLGKYIRTSSGRARLAAWMNRVGYLFLGEEVYL